MKIELKEFTIRDIVNGYKNNDEEGVVGFGGKLNIRPKYQREFVYDDEKRNAVIDTIRKGFPLNVMYWATTPDGNYELMDGQQRTISFCSYHNKEFSLNHQYFFNLEKDEKEQFLDYKLFIYICDGTDKEKLDWFKIINIAGVKLTDQELRNAVYTGEWLTQAKKYFSKTSCPAYQIGNKYVNGSPIRQDFLEKALEWISDGKDVCEYMAKHQKDTNANELWLYFQSVMNWVDVTFIDKTREMKGVEWGLLYNKFKDADLDPIKIDIEVKQLYADDDVTNKRGIYYYVLNRDERHLNIRAFSDTIKHSTYQKQKGICVKCNEHFDISDMEADHITPWSEGGKTIAQNCQMLCKNCNRIKSNR